MRKPAILAALAICIFGCGAPDTEETLQIISPHWQGIEDEFGGAFEDHWREKTGGQIKVVWRDMGGTSDALRWIKSAFEKRSEGIDVDIFFGGGIDPYRQLDELGLLVRHKVSDDIIGAIPADLKGIALYDGEYAWYGTAISGFGVIYNKPVLSKLAVGEPATWEDLAKPELFTWVGTGDPRHSGTVHMMYEIILQAYGWQRGWQIITAMSANTRDIVTASGDIPRSVASGHIAAGTAIDFYAWTQVAEVGEEEVGFVMPEGLTVVNPDSIAILNGAPNFEAAKAFVEFVLSEDGQKLWYLKVGAAGGPRENSLLRMPVREDLYGKYAADSPVRMNPFKEAKGFTYDAAVGSARYEALNYLIGAVLVDCHESLVAAWKKAIDSGRTEEVLAELSEPPVGEEELNELAGTTLADPIARNELVAKWVTSAREKYERLAE